MGINMKSQLEEIRKAAKEALDSFETKEQIEELILTII